MARIDWNQDAETIHNQIRAFSPRPGAWAEVEINGQLKRLKIFKSEVVDGDGEIGGLSLFQEINGWLLAAVEPFLFLKFNLKEKSDYLSLILL